MADLINAFGDVANEVTGIVKPAPTTPDNQPTLKM